MNCPSDKGCSTANLRVLTHEGIYENDTNEILAPWYKLGIKEIPGKRRKNG